MRTRICVPDRKEGIPDWWLGEKQKTKKKSEVGVALWGWNVRELGRKIQKKIDAVGDLLPVVLGI